MYIQEQEKENRRLAKNQEKNTEASDMVKQIKATKAKQSKYMRYREARLYYCWPCMKKIMEDHNANKKR